MELFITFNQNAIDKYEDAPFYSRKRSSNLSSTRSSGFVNCFSSIKICLYEFPLLGAS